MAFGNEVSLVARNFKDFLSLFINLRELYILERFRLYSSRVDFVKDYDKHYSEGISSRESEHDFFIKLLRENVEGIIDINDVYQYINDLREQVVLEIDREWDI
ncbi:hypothetical protein [Paenibacillus sp. SN-8-1]|uniref:hypothetical protein n=1 Tax=Paenibacillus sp. SN-8-1 TaxID=3435409 RepID=UPI003D9A4AD1